MPTIQQIESSIVCDFLKKIVLFDELDQKEIELIAAITEIRGYSKDEQVYTENSPRREMYLLYSGEIELIKRTGFGNKKRLAFFGQFDFFGEGALMDEYPHSTTARAFLASTVMVIDRAKFENLVKDRSNIAYKVLSKVARVISRRIREASTHVVNAGAQYISGRTRTEHDLLGDREVPFEFYYGIQTLRALENFNISGIVISHFPVLIESLAIIKMAAARANCDLGLLSRPIKDAIENACNAIINGKYHTHFVVDMIQGGAGTSTNMNANEVIANRALEILGHEKGDYKYCHPNNHVNLSQSTNDAYPSALKIALLKKNIQLTKVVKKLVSAFAEKGSEFANVIKMGRTQLQDAVPMTLGQSFDSFAATFAEEIIRLDQNSGLFLEVNMGGTAIGTGINADPEYGEKVVGHLRDITGFDIKLAPNLVEATQDTGAFVMYSSAIKRLAVKLSKICNDLRLLSSGPRAGLNEINLPAMQPGSSIMPGKVNPVIPEVVNQIAFKVIGNDLTVTLAAEAGQLELNVMEPVIIQSLLESIEMLMNGMETLIHRCISGITANVEACRKTVENSIGLVTALSPMLGYEVCTELAKEALLNNRGVYELVLEKNLLTKRELEELLSPENMIGPRKNH